MARRVGPRAAVIEAKAERLSRLLGDGNPHTNAEIKAKCGLPWDHPITADVRAFLRERGVFITPHALEGYWVMTDNSTDIRTHAQRRCKNHYREAVRIAQSAAGSAARNPTDIMLSYELRERRMAVFALGTTLGKSPAEMAADMTPLPTPPGVTTL